MTEEQEQLFESAPEWREHWDDSMPEFTPNVDEVYDSIRVMFRSEADRQAFFDRVGVAPRRKGMWYPHRPIEFSSASDHRASVPQGAFPVYVISKGRAERRLTADALERLGINYRLVIEPQERDAYAEHVEDERLLTVPFSDLGRGSIPARNWVWEHAIGEGHERHWILDDNIANFIRLDGNRRMTIRDENPFIPAERFVSRYANVGLAGLQYRQFAPIRAPYKLNTRVYSCILIDNSLPFRWRGRYNEDTDLSLRVLKSGLCTVLFHAYRIDKTTTMRMEGGNTDDLYFDDGRLKMAESLRDQHPDCVSITRKWGRWQHTVDYGRFKRNELKRASAEKAA